MNLGPVAQWIEHITSNDTVTGSSPVGITIFLEKYFIHIYN